MSLFIYVIWNLQNTNIAVVAATCISLTRIYKWWLSPGNTFLIHNSIFICFFPFLTTVSILGLSWFYKMNSPIFHIPAPPKPKLWFVLLANFGSLQSIASLYRELLWYSNQIQLDSQFQIVLRSLLTRDSWCSKKKPYVFNIRWA